MKISGINRIDLAEYAKEALLTGFAKITTRTHQRMRQLPVLYSDDSIDLIVHSGRIKHLFPMININKYLSRNKVIRLDKQESIMYRFLQAKKKFLSEAKHDIQ